MRVSSPLGNVTRVNFGWFFPADVLPALLKYGLARVAPPRDENRLREGLDIVWDDLFGMRCK